MGIFVPTSVAVEAELDRRSIVLKQRKAEEKAWKAEFAEAVRVAVSGQIDDPASREKVRRACFILVNRSGGRIASDEPITAREAGRVIADALIGGVEEYT